MTVGETMALFRADQPGAPVRGSHYTLSFGGAESNVAIGLARMGHHVAWVSALGADGLGDMIASSIQAEGVRVFARRDDTHPTGAMTKSPSQGGERYVSYYRSNSAATTLDEADIPDAELGSARIVHLTGITPALSESTARMVRTVASRAKARGATVSFDVNYRPALWSPERAAAFCRGLLPEVDTVFGGPEELGLLVAGEASGRDLLERVAALGPRTVVLKQGEHGASALIEGSYHERAAWAVDVVDTVGAGDAFVAGYLSAQLDRLEADDALGRATWTAAQACRDLGDWEGAPHRADMNLSVQGAHR